MNDNDVAGFGSEMNPRASGGQLGCRSIHRFGREEGCFPGRHPEGAYRRLAKKLHPDLNPGNEKAEEQFKDVSATDDLLGDNEKQARFDRGEIDESGAERPRHRYYPDDSRIIMHGSSVGDHAAARLSALYRHQRLGKGTQGHPADRR